MLQWEEDTEDSDYLLAAAGYLDWKLYINQDAEGGPSLGIFDGEEFSDIWSPDDQKSRSVVSCKLLGEKLAFALEGFNGRFLEEEELSVRISGAYGNPCKNAFTDFLAEKIMEVVLS